MDNEQHAKPSRANLILAGLIALFGAIVFAVTVSSGRADSAMLFVGLPALLAAGLALVPGRTPHGRVFRCTTIALLLAAVAFHEGAICVILAAPLVYLVAHGTTALIALVRRRARTFALAPLPLLLLGGVEGTAHELRIHPEQTVEVTRTVALTPDEVRTALGVGPQPVPVRSVSLRTLGVPLPHHVHGGGLAVGDRWSFGYADSSHGSGGQILTEVTHSAPDAVCFQVVRDSAITARWFDWRDTCVRWRAVDSRHSEISLTLSTRRGLDPSWYFGPLQDRLLHEGGEHLLDMLKLR